MTIRNGEGRVSERTTRSWALTYAELGWRVFPVAPGGKRPCYRGWQLDATTDPRLIERYWRNEPSPNIGIICGEAFVAFDIEADHLPALRTWMRTEGHRLPDTPIARTGRGGIHILVEPTGVEGGRDLFLADAHIGELKAAGGFIVAAPSVTVGPYAWERPPGPVAPVPAWLLGLSERARRPTRRFSTRVRATVDGRRRLDALARAVTTSPEGRRNNLLYWSMRRALEEGIPARFAGLALLRAAANAGLTDREARATLRSALDAHGAAP